MTPDQAQDYRPHIDTVFTLEGICELRLEAVETFEDSATEGLSLQFTGPREVLVAQGIRALDHPVLGRVELFLVPIQGSHRDCYCYEAVFNRLKPQASSPGGA